MNDDICALSACELKALFRSRALAPSEVLEAVAARIEAVNPVVNAFADLDLAAARTVAQASDARHKAGRPLGDFDGIPLTVKDNITAAGLRCAWGSELFKDFRPAVDETPVARLRQQGAIVIGKTTVSEFTMGGGQVSTRLFGTTRNPWNPELTTGSSSGGASAAVATGMGPVALATDGGGSIRRPAGYNGLVGLKPSVGRVARANGLPVVLDGVEVVGPITRTVADCAMVLGAIQGPSHDDPSSRSFAVLHDEPIRRRLRIRYVPAVAGYGVDTEIAEACATAAARMAALGHDVEEGVMPVDVERYLATWPTFTDGGLAWLVRDMAWQGRIGAVYEAMVERGNLKTAVDYVEARTAFAEIAAQFAAFFETCDLLMTPCSGAMPWAAEEPGPRHHRVFTGVANAAGIPGMSLPAGLSPSGLPIGFQLVGAHGTDWTLIAAARQYEQGHPWADRWPEPARRTRA